MNDSIEDNNNIENETLKKYELNRNVFYIISLLTIFVVFIKLFLHIRDIFYYGLEIIILLADFAVLFIALLKSDINLYSEKFEENIEVKNKIFETMWAIAFFVYVAGPALIMFFYPQKVLIAGLYVPIWFIPVSYYLYRMAKNKNLMNKQDKAALKVLLSSKTNFVIMGLFYGITMEFFFSNSFTKGYNLIEALLMGTFFGLMMYVFLKKFKK